jgi:drug/metabolite transporter (DMT)-like permease
LATSELSPSLIYPVVAIGGLMLTTVFSAFVFKEKMHWWQWVGVLIGSVAVGILSI